MGNLFQELKRRKVFRVAAVYAVVAWLLIEVTSTILPTFDAPAWVNQTVTLLLLLGFPIALILSWAYEVTPEGVKPDSLVPPSQGLHSTSAQPINYVILAIVLLVAGFQVADRFLFNGQQAASQSFAATTSQQNSTVIRFNVQLSEDADLYVGGELDAAFGRPASTSLTISNDGSLLVYSAWQVGSDGQPVSQLYLRRLDQERANPIDGTEGASGPFFSPDNSSIGFFAGNSLRRVPVSGGIAQIIIADPEGQFFGFSGASWGDEGTIVYVDSVPGSTNTLALYRVPATGGTGELLADPNSSKNQYRGYVHPQLLPGSEVLLFSGVAQTRDPERAEVIAMDLASGTQVSLLTNAMNPRYVAETGHLLFMRQGSLMAVGFDPDRLVLEGEPAVVLVDVMQALNMPNPGWDTGVGQVAISSAGNLVYLRGGIHPEITSVLMHVPINGEAEPLNTISRRNIPILNVRLSPGGGRLTFDSPSANGNRIYVHDNIRDLTWQLNTGGFRSGLSNWSPDGESIAFSSDREDGVSNIYRMAADSSDEQPERLAPSDQTQSMQSWSFDGVIAYVQGGDIWILPTEGEPAPFFTSDARESYASFSPNGRWLAYASGQGYIDGDVYIRPYPGPGPAILISSNGSHSPAWSRDGAQLYFLQSDEGGQKMTMMVVDISEGRPSPSRSLIDPWPYATTIVSRSYDVLEDGAFIAMMTGAQINVAGTAGTTRSAFRQRHRVDELQMVLNFFELLRNRVTD